ncbi:MAG: hypothetical protein NVS3B20_16290 [Polyangiales bacterium]
MNHQLINRIGSSLVAGALAAVVVSCGGAQAPASAPRTNAKESTDVPPPPASWDALSHEQKLDYMSKAVMPKMGALFHDYDAKRFANPTCEMCHGSGAKNGSFKMPNPELPKLSVEGEFKKHRDKDAAIVDFMMAKVEQQMAGLLNEAPYDVKTHKGFGCFECHTKADDAGKTTP